MTMTNNLPDGLEVMPILVSKEQPTFVKTPKVEEIIKWALTYLNTGFPIHFRGPAGTGKTTLAMYIAGQLGRPVILIHGDEELTSSTLVGSETGFRRKKLVDNFIHSVLKSEELLTKDWIDNRLTVACRYGFTLIYDEFTRARPEANNVLLSILEEKILDLPAGRGENSHLGVHPEFRAIFTSNPADYAGVHAAQDALLDRMITINVGHYDEETETAITIKRSDISSQDAKKIVAIVRDLRKTYNNNSISTVRASIKIAKVLKTLNAKACVADENFKKACLDILSLETASFPAYGDRASKNPGENPPIGETGKKDVEEKVLSLILKHTGGKTYGI